MNSVDALILAGAPAGPELNPDNEMASRAMVDVGGKSMLQRVVDALRACPAVSRIAVVGDVSADGLDVVLESGDSLLENIRRGLETLNDQGRVLILGSDVPLLTGDAVSDFLDKACGLDADLVYPVLRKETCEASFPGMKRTYLKTADGVFTGGNLMLVRSEFVLRNWDLIAAMYAARKQVLSLARIIGLAVLARVIAGQFIPGVLRLAYLENAVSRAVGARVAAVVSEFAEIGEDVDKASDLEAVRSILAAEQ